MSELFKKTQETEVTMKEYDGIEMEVVDFDKVQAKPGKGNGNANGHTSQYGGGNNNKKWH